VLCPDLHGALSGGNALPQNAGVCGALSLHLLLSQVSAGSKLHFLGRNIRAEQLVQNELEFEWLRQFYIQVGACYMCGCRSCSAEGFPTLRSC
jgi:hypothetical protein